MILKIFIKEKIIKYIIIILVLSGCSRFRDIGEEGEFEYVNKFEPIVKEFHVERGQKFDRTNIVLTGKYEIKGKRPEIFLSNVYGYAVLSNESLITNGGAITNEYRGRFNTNTSTFEIEYNLPERGLYFVWVEIENRKGLRGKTNAVLIEIVDVPEVIVREPELNNAKIVTKFNTYGFSINGFVNIDKNFGISNTFIKYYTNGQPVPRIERAKTVLKYRVNDKKIYEWSYNVTLNKRLYDQQTNIIEVWSVSDRGIYSKTNVFYIICETEIYMEVIEPKNRVTIGTNFNVIGRMSGLAGMDRLEVIVRGEEDGKIYYSSVTSYNSESNIVVEFTNAIGLTNYNRYEMDVIGYSKALDNAGKNKSVRQTIYFTAAELPKISVTNVKFNNVIITPNTNIIVGNKTNSIYEISNNVGFELRGSCSIGGGLVITNLFVIVSNGSYSNIEGLYVNGRLVTLTNIYYSVVTNTNVEYVKNSGSTLWRWVSDNKSGIISGRNYIYVVAVSSLGGRNEEVNNSNLIHLKTDYEAPQVIIDNDIETRFTNGHLDSDNKCEVTIRGKCVDELLKNVRILYINQNNISVTNITNIGALTNYNVKFKLSPGYYLFWADAEDRVGNRGETTARFPIEIASKPWVKVVSFTNNMFWVNDYNYELRFRSTNMTSAIERIYLKITTNSTYEDSLYYVNSLTTYNYPNAGSGPFFEVLSNRNPMTLSVNLLSLANNPGDYVYNYYAVSAQGTYSDTNTITVRRRPDYFGVDIYAISYDGIDDNDATNLLYNGKCDMLISTNFPDYNLMIPPYSNRNQSGGYAYFPWRTNVQQPNETPNIGPWFKTNYNLETVLIQTNGILIRNGDSFWGFSKFGNGLSVNAPYTQYAYVAVKMLFIGSNISFQGKFDGSGASALNPNAQGRICYFINQKQVSDDGYRKAMFLRLTNNDTMGIYLDYRSFYMEGYGGENIYKRLLTVANNRLNTLVFMIYKNGPYAYGKKFFIDDFRINIDPSKLYDDERIINFE